MNNFVKGELAGAAGGSRAAIPAQKVTSAIVTAAGLGTRMWPATRVTQKELLCVIDRPALDYVLDELANAGIERVSSATAMRNLPSKSCDGHGRASGNGAA